MDARRIVATLVVVGTGVLGSGLAVAHPLIEPGRWVATSHSTYAALHYHYCFRNMRSVAALAGEQHAHCRLAQPVQIRGQHLSIHLVCHMGLGAHEYRSEVITHEQVNAAGTALTGQMVAKVRNGAYVQVIHEHIVSHRVGACRQ